MGNLNQSEFRQAWPKTGKEETHEEVDYLKGLTGFESWHYAAQLRKYIVQMAAVFAGIKVRVGWTDEKQPRLAPVPIKNASSDRVVASIKAENTQNVPVRLPMMCLQLMDIELAPDRRHGVAQQRRTTYMPAGGLFPDDIKVVDQRMPVPYNGLFEVSILASNQDQLYQIIEQLLTLFDPTLQIQRSDEMQDWTKLSYVELTGVVLGENVPIGADRRMIECTFSFKTDLYLSVPAVVHDKFVQEIHVRIGTVSQDIDSSYDIISDLDSQGFEYEKWFDLDNVDLD